nr:electron transfer flavoprotein subunit beta/FixA family protein [Ardenticatena sp.]
MRIIIPMKRVPDTADPVTVRDGRVDLAAVQTWAIGPNEEYAIEEALRLVEKLGEGTVTLLNIGPEEAQETIRKGLAMGAHDAYQCQDEAFDTLDALGRARVLAAAIEKIGDYDIIWGGMQSSDTNDAQTTIMLAELLDLPHVSAVMTVEEVGDGFIIVRAEAEGGVKKVKVPTPCVLAEAQGPNEPRYPSLRGIMGAKKKPLTVWNADDLGLDTDELEPLVEVLTLEPPPARTAGRILEGEPEEVVRELVRLLHEEAKVI